MTCPKCNKGELRKERGSKNTWCTNSECPDSFYQQVILGISDKVKKIDDQFTEVGL